MKCSEIVLPDSSPEGIWKEASEFIAKYHQDTVKREVIFDHDISYALLNSDKMRYKSMKPFREYTLTAIHHWLSEYESQGHVGVVDSGELFVFEKNVLAPSIERIVALRYHLVAEDPTVDELCRKELKYVQSQGKRSVQNYIAWLLEDNKNRHRTFYFDRLIPNARKILRDNRPDTLKTFRLLRQALNESFEDAYSLSQ
ncbi:MAG: hypothetical protein ABII01_03625 [Candidatus Woesearchaeota archaeon]